MLGDATASVSTRGDLVLAGTGDPGRVATENTQAFSYNGNDYGNATTWFSLWTERTAIDLFSAGGSLTPSVQSVSLGKGGDTEPLQGQNYSRSDGRFIFPSRLGVVAANGSVYLGASALGVGPQPNNPAYSLLLAPSDTGRLAMLAGDSIYASGYAVNQSGESLGSIPTPFAPAFVGRNGFSSVVDNLGGDAIQDDFSLFALRRPTDLARPGSQAQPARFYAGQGDIVGLRSGEIISFTSTRQGQVRYEAAGPVWMRAGRDIVGSGTYLGESTVFPKLAGYNGDYTGESRGNLFVHNRPEDVSVVSAGRDIIYSSFNVAGPGTLEVSAGRNLLMEDKASITSLGPVAVGDSRPGASIVLEAGVGPDGLDYLKFVTPYLDRANQALNGVPLAGQTGKVVKAYEAELLQWLKERYAFSGDAEQARAYFAGLGPEQQRIFARSVYFAEVRAGGREFNLSAGPRSGSFLRSRAAIEGLLPSKDVAGNPIVYDGDITLYGGAGVHTRFGGDIQMLSPGGQQVFGIEGTAPPATAGVLTQGAGDIQLYAQGSILLGQSRIMTTFGGSILAWSDAGDINAGRGSKTTVLYTPPKRVYDNWGNVTLSPNVPSAGAGIATLAPIAEVPAGDIDLLAPAGTIDAGEAGIRVSGNVNIAALRVVNAANIQTQGKSSGVPVTAAVNTGAMTSASAAGAAASQAAEDAARSQQAAAKQGRASIVTVEVLGFGAEPVEREPQPAAQQKTSGYNPGSPVQVLGAGPLSEQARARLTDEERRQISL